MRINNAASVKEVGGDEVRTLFFQCENKNSNIDTRPEL